MDNELWVILLPITLLPVFFAMGWFAARIDMKTVLKQAKSVPAGFYKSLDALVDRNSGRAPANWRKSSTSSRSLTTST